jgi:hypothetical protein
MGGRILRCWLHEGGEGRGNDKPRCSGIGNGTEQEKNGTVLARVAHLTFPMPQASEGENDALPDVTFTMGWTSDKATSIGLKAYLRKGEVARWMLRWPRILTNGDEEGYGSALLAERDPKDEKLVDLLQSSISDERLKLSVEQFGWLGVVDRVTTTTIYDRQRWSGRWIKTPRRGGKRKSFVPTLFCQRFQRPREERTRSFHPGAMCL